MNQDEFFGKVKDLAGLESVDEAKAAAGATLLTVAERVGASEAEQLANESGLPDEVTAFLKIQRDRAPEEFSLDEFFKRAGERLGTAIQKTVKDVRAVAEVFQGAANPPAVDKLYERLPDDFKQLFDAGPPPSESRSEIR